MLFYLIIDTVYEMVIRGGRYLIPVFALRQRTEITVDIG